MLNTPFSPWPLFSNDEVQAVATVLASNKVNYWTGQECRQFESEFATWAGTTRAIALANGTLALDLALQGLGIGSVYGGSPQDEVVVTPRSYVASVSSVVNAGAIPIFADVDLDSGNITAESIAAVLTQRTKAIIIVHLGGWPCEMDEILALARAHGLKVIEDCAQAHGATYKGKSVGSLGDVGAWSFCQDKIMTTGGEGGMVTCNDEALWSRMWSFKDHGKSWDAVYNREHPPGFRYVIESVGTNWRMLEMQAAIGRIQLNRMPEWHAKRQRNATALSFAVSSLASVRTPEVPQHLTHAYYKAYFYIRPEALKHSWSRDRIVAEINSRGVPCYHGSCSEIYLEKAFNDLPRRPKLPLRNARLLGETSVMMLVHPTLTNHEINLSASVLGQVIVEATR
jgi:dTDP-4-amino-4,6-dideoxygalactose transaminase